MKLIVTKSMYAHLKAELAPLKAQLESGGYYAWDTRSIDLPGIDRKLLEKVIANVKPKKGRQARQIESELTSWLAVIDAQDVGGLRAKSLREFTLLATKWIRDLPRRWLYQRGAPWYVKQITYHPPEKRRGDYSPSPAWCGISLARYRLGEAENRTLTIYASDARGTVAEVLAAKGYVAATSGLNEAYDADYTEWHRLQGSIGLRVVANIPDAVVHHTAQTEEDRWRKAKREQIIDGCCVIDVVSESGTSKTEDSKVSSRFWESWDEQIAEASDREDDDADEDIDEGSAPPADEVSDDGAVLAGYDTKVPAPTYFAFMLFDLLRHARYEAHLSQIETYEYRTDLASKLVLPPDDLDLIDLLVAGNGDEDSGFGDIVEGKSAGAVVLCTGIPGTGKTLTAQVFSESTKRPLYSIQCSQLGVSPKALEENLLKAFARALRWNAVLLLDEADVYVRERSDDLDQNAIVGVFLRVLEYYPSVMFLTTNRADLVDDAIASRCVARIDYGLPSGDLLLRIWRTLAANAGVAISEETIAAVVAEWPAISGRDVLQLLKLGRKVAQRRGDAEVSFDVLRFVRRYKPTKDYGSKMRAPVRAS